MLTSMSYRTDCWPRLVRHLPQHNYSTNVTSFASRPYQQMQVLSASNGPSSGPEDPGSDPYFLKVVQGRSKGPLHFNDRYNRRFGEDSWFFSSTPVADVLGVADGVGGWRDMGVDAGRFATELMTCCSGQTQRPGFDGKSPRDLLIAGYQELRRREQPVVGSSTACLVAMHRPDCTLYTANLGDSGFLVVRNGKVLYRSEEQIHSFNTPFQLTVPPIGRRMVDLYCDRPEMAQSTTLSLQPHDLVLLATDGLFDNMPENMLLQMLKGIRGDSESELQAGASLVVEKARELSLNTNYPSPFAIKAKENNVPYYGGGKPDDITLILASVEVPKRE